MFTITMKLVFVTLGLVTICASESFPNPLSIVSIARSSDVSINDGVNSLVNRHKSCPEGYELGKMLIICFYLQHHTSEV